ATLTPQNVGHLFLISPAIDPDKEKFWWFSKWGRMPFIQVFLPRSLNLATYEKYEHARQLRGLLPYWSQLKPPVTVVQGAQDWLIDQGNLAFAKRMLSDKCAQFQLLPDAGHLITNSHAPLICNMICHAADSLYQRHTPSRVEHIGGRE
ncbi:MAG: alpha/beta hydrolase, partial [Rudanella sp.]|nr:alpha/beta hydrolase [Rudanella sp.]